MAVTEGDTTVFNASAYRTPEGSMLEELVKQLPGGEIDEDGKLLKMCIRDSTPRVDIDGRLYTPQEISAIILQKMKKTAEDYLGQEVTEAVILSLIHIYLFHGSL